jgi:hypothetical protein
MQIHKWFKESTYVQLSFLVNVKKKINTAKLRTFGTRDVTKRNFPNSLDDHARSRYLPPLNRVKPAIERVKMLLSTNVVVRNVHG